MNSKTITFTDYEQDDLAKPASLVDLLRRRASQHGEQVVYTYLTDGEEEEVNITFAELDRKARAVGARLQAAGAAGARVLLLYPTGLEYISALWGCFYAGAVAVPAYPPRLTRLQNRLQGVASDSGARFALTSHSILQRMEELFTQTLGIENLQWLETENLEEGWEQQWQEPHIEENSLALLQYTSGSTGMPKGVMVSHGNLLHNEAMIQSAFQQSARSVVVGWLPLYHDMGLIGNVLQPLFLGARCILMSPVSMLQRPFRWLQAISRYRATTSGGPNFAYDLCVRKVTREQRETLDLSSWVVAFNGAEPVRYETLKRFADAFKSCGFSEEAFHPCYGLAEATLFVAGDKKGGGLLNVKDIQARALAQNRVVEAAPGDEEARSLVSCGYGSPSQRIVIVNPETMTRCAHDEVGEVWVSGPSVAQGYWNHPEETERIFRARLADTGEGPFLRTGDLGGVLGGELFITGRLKDLIIIRGRNHYPQDIELTVERCHDILCAGSGAAFSVEVGDEERLVVVQEAEPRRGPGANLDEIILSIRRAVGDEHEIQPHAVVLIKRGTIQKTSSGKIQRRSCRAQFLEGNLQVLAAWKESASGDEGATHAADAPSSIENFEEWMREQLAEKLGLEAQQIEISEPIAQYGLDSLMAVELAHSIEAWLGISLPVTSILQGYSIAQISEQVRLSVANAPEESRGGLPAAQEPEADLALSHNQQSLWFLHQLDPLSPAYNVARAMRLRGDLDASVLRGAFQELVNRHPSLRTTFAAPQGKPVRHISSHEEVAFRAHDATQWDEASLNERLVEESLRPFNLEQGPLMRVELFRRSAGEHVLLLVMHHIITDFWSLAVLTHELEVLYAGAGSDAPPPLPALQVDYDDYVRWQLQTLAGPDGERLWSYWREQLAGASPVLQLPTDHPRPAAPSAKGAAYSSRLSPELYRELKALARAHGVTMYVTLLAAFYVLLHRYSGQTDILVGSPAAGRTRLDLSGIVGYFVNPLALRADLSGDPDFADFLGRVKQVVLGGFEHQEYPLDLLVERLRPARHASGSSFFQVMFVLQKSHLDDEPELAALALNETGAQVNFGDLTISPVGLAQRVAQFDLTLMAAEVKGGLSVTFEYSSELFEETTIARVAEHWRCLLEGVVADARTPLSRLPLLTAPERRQLLVDWNLTGREYPPSDCLQHPFERQAARTPDATALVSDAGRLTYAELDRDANRLAHLLLGSGLTTEARVGVMLSRTPHLLVCLLGVLKAGGAYVPLDPAYPQERISFMLEDADVDFLLTERALLASVPDSNRTRVLVLEELDEALSALPGSRPHVRLSPENLSHIIYTSGSTGKPKGVAIRHRSAATLLHWARESFSEEEMRGVLASTSINFDLSVFELFAPLNVGGAVVLADNALALPTLPARGEVTLVNTVPSAMAELTRTGGLPESVRVVNLAGEPLTRDLAGRVYALPSVQKVFNLYGPSEDTTYSTAACVGRGEGRRITIGQPLPNTRAYVLDEHLQMVPAGVVGELYLGGDGLARGYLNRPGLTAERFVPDPFSTAAGARLYRTGDRVRWLPCGELEYLGRLDHQVKVRGFRIELGEIEAALAAHPAVRQGVVVVREDVPGDKRLVAYVVGEQGAAPTHGEMRDLLKRRLPDYMVPSVFMVLAELPLTSNGKIDRKRLPAPETGRDAAGDKYVAPRTTAEEVLAGIWSEVLRVERVGIHDDFFALGGHSLLATQIISRVREAFRVEVALRGLFEEPTVAGLARRIEASVRAEAGAPMPPLRKTSREGELPLSFAQQRLWFLDQLEPGNSFYNIPAALRLAGSLDAAALGRSFDLIVGRHEVLRTRFVNVNGQPVQRVDEDARLPMELIDLSAKEEAEREAAVLRLAGEEARKPFDLARGPLMRASLLRLGEEEHVLLVTMHHIVSDGWSINVLMRELTALYEAEREGRAGVLAALPVQYADYADWQRRWLTEEAVERLLGYWRDRLAGAPATHGLPTDRPRPPAQSYEGARRSLLLPASLSDSLKALGRREGLTLFVTLLAAFKTLLARYSGGTDIVVGTPVAGRNRVEVEDLVGLFVNTLVLRTDLSDDPTFRGLAWRVRDEVLEAHARQDLPFEKLVEALHPERDMSRSPLFQVMFVLQNANVEEFEIPGLKLSQIDIDSGTAKFDLTLFMTETPTGLACSMEYSTDLFEAATIERLLGNFQTLLGGITADPERRVSHLPVLTGEEQQKLLRFANGAPPAEEATTPFVHEMFEARVALAPEAVALESDDERVTYRELDARANRLARYLRRLGVGPEVRVGIYLERSTALLVSVLGVLKAGGAYVPLDLTTLGGRLRWMLEDSGAAVVLTEERLKDALPTSDALTVVCLDTTRAEIAAESEVKVKGGAADENLAYVIYTSGSMGKPKGAMITHRGLANYLNWSAGRYVVEGGKGAPLHSTVAFDLTVTSLFLPLLAGQSVFISPEGEQADTLASTLRKHRGFSFIKLTPAHLRLLSQQLSGEELRDSAGCLVVGGEALSAQDLSFWRHHAPATAIVNEYGPTETVVGCCVYEVPAGFPETCNIPIGRPIANTQLYLLDRHFNLVPAGAVGELYVGGAGLARGYLGRPALTAERFIPHPFSNEAGARLYRTGDLARFLADGQLEYLGRADHQVKVRGFRIEPGEVEAALGQHAGVRECVVVARGEAGGEKRLVAYVVAEQGREPDAKELRQYAREQLPDYMVPTLYVFLERLPLTTNGKVDRRALPEPPQQENTARTPPRTPVEEILASIWSEVLGVEGVGVHDDFFELGGHSLLATQVVSRAREAFGVEVGLRALFERPTVAGLADVVEAARGAGRAQAVPVQRREGDSEAAPLSSAQQRLWFLNQLEPDNSFYNAPLALRLGGSLDVEALEKSLSEVIRRHEILRTTLPVRDGQPVQLIAPAQPFILPTVDLRHLSVAEQSPEAERLMTAEAQKPFDLAHGPLLRATLIKLNEQEHILAVTLHHIIADGWSMGVLVREVTELYGACVEERTPALEELPIQYADYAEWQRQWLQGEALQSQIAYWRRQFAEAPARLKLPADRPHPMVQSFRGGRVPVEIPRPLVESLQALSMSENATLFMTLLAAFQTLLHRYSGQEDIVVGTPIANRTRPEFEALIGLFANTLMLRTDLSGDPSFRELLCRVKDISLEAHAHQEAPFERLVEELQPERTLSRTPLFQVMLALQNAPLPPLRLRGLEVSPLEAHTATSKFDLTLNLREGSGGLSGWVEYSTDLFDAQTIERMVAHFGRLLAGVTTAPDLRLSELPLLGDEEQHQLLVEFNRTSADYPADATLHELFEQQASHTPDAPALVYEDETLTYAELDRRASLLAARLQRLGVRPEQRVALLMERSAEMVIAVLGVLKAGGAYVPIDPAYPQERVRFMTSDAGVSLVLTQQRLTTRLAGCEARILCIDEQQDATESEQAQGSPRSGIEVRAGEDARRCDAALPDNLAYVIYTSGSTGTPKGVAITHRSVSNLVAALDRAIYSALPGNLRVGLNAPLAFDASVKQVWAALLGGHTLVVMPEEARRDPGLLAEKAGTLDVLDCTPTQLGLLLDEECEWPRAVLCGGEATDAKLWARLSTLSCESVGDTGGGCQFYNVYGPTECTVDASVARVSEWPHSPVIGRPVANARAYVLDARMQPVAMGASGELYIGGEGVGRGYLNRPGQTAERFVPDPFSSESGARMYRTGDEVRWVSGGALEFVGRMDGQVKVRGFRIELGEVEAVLKRHPLLSDAAVITRAGRLGDSQLVAYVVSTDRPAPSAGEIRTHLKRWLPEYMLPAVYVFLDHLPLTINGKVDRRALPEPPQQENTARTPPRTPVEEILASIWSEVLGVEGVGVHDDFFELGGHSLLATQVVSRAREAFGVEVGLRALFERPTVAGLADAVEAGRSVSGRREVGRIQRREGDSEAAPLSFAQQRLWFLEQFNSDGALYNMPAVLRLSGSLDVEALESSLNEVIRRHEVLHTTFRLSKGEVVQAATAHAPLTLPLIDLRGEGAEHESKVRRLVFEEARRSFDLTRPPLIRATLLRLGEEEHVLLLTMHHIVSDGWSIGILIREITTLYAAFSAGQPSPLPELPIQYADFAHWQRERLQGEVLEEQLSYWRQQLSGSSGVLALPTDRPRPAVLSSRGAVHPISLPEDLTDALKTFSRRQGVTLFTTLLAGFKALLYRYTNQSDISVGTPIAGRNRVEVENLIGFFVNTLVLRSELSGEQSFNQLVRQEHEIVLNAYTHQEVPFERLVEELQPERTLSRTPLFQVMLALQNAPLPPLHLRGLEVSTLEAHTATSKFELTLNLREGIGGLSGWVEYSTDLFDEVTIERMVAHFGQLLAGLVASPDLRLSRLPLLTDEEQHRLLVEFNRTSADYPADTTLHELFERQAACTPHAIALVYEDETLTYAELEHRASLLAARLQRLGVRPEQRVALLMERSAEMVVAILAVLKAAGAYVPIDPSYPEERVRFIAEDAGAGLVLTQRRLAENFRAGGDLRVMAVDEPWETAEEEARAEAEREDGAGSGVGAVADNLAYVIYTSGSTGKPKGVGITHRNVLRLFRATEEYFSFSDKDVWTLFHSYAFDFSVWELWGALLHGGRLVVVPYWLSRSPEAFYALLRTNRVTILNQTPSAFRQLIKAEETLGAPGGLALRQVIFGGEALELQSLKPWFARHGDQQPRLINMYGITETTVHVTYRPIDESHLDGTSTSPIGRPIPDLQAYLLDEHLQPVPIGVPAELYVGGAGLARGYLGRPALTAERFIPHPFSNEAGARLYRTGDLARFLADGQLEYLGRADHQVKVRGFRIELGEVEAVLGQHAGVRECVVVARGEAGGEKRLVAYVVSRRADLAAEELRRHLEERLPPYMLPAMFVFLDRLPLTTNGKVDRRALPEPEVQREQAGHYEEAQTEAERVLAGIWSEVLRVERVGIHDNFFALGGDSILSVQVAARVKEKGWQVSIQQIFQHQTIHQLAQVLTTEESNTEQAPVGRQFCFVSDVDRAQLPAELEDAYPLSMLQAGMIFHNDYQPDSTLYHNVASFHLRAPFDAQSFREALRRLAVRHPVLRTSFDLTSYSEPLQLVHRVVEIPLRTDDISHLPPTQQDELISAMVEEEKRRKFDLSEAPLLRFQLHRRGEDSFQLTLTEHHAILDGWSVASMLSELFHSYLSLAEGSLSPPEPPAPHNTFRDFIEMERESADSAASQQYWGQKLSGYKFTPLPGWTSQESHAHPGRVLMLDVAVAPAASEGLKSAARAAGVPLKSVLLAAHLRVIGFLTGRHDVLTGMISHGRPESPGGTQALGLFLNTLPFGLSLQGGTWLDLAREAFALESEMLPFRRYPLAKIQKEHGGQSLFETNFNFTHFHVYQSLMGLKSVEMLGKRTFAETNFALTAEFYLDLLSSQVKLTLAGDGNKLSSEQLKAIGDYYARALSAIADNPSADYETLSLLSDEEQHQLLVEFNRTSVPYPDNTTIHGLFEQQASRTPDALALVYEDETLTYAELDRRASLLAARLQRLGVRPEQRVALLMERSAEMVIAVLGVLKAGGAYVPIDPAYPQERVRFMTSDAGVSLVLTQRRVAQTVTASEGMRVIVVDTPCERAQGEAEGDGGGCLAAGIDDEADTGGAAVLGEDARRCDAALPDNLAYVIYTSGSTGTPKGVAITHRSVSNLVAALDRAIYSALPGNLRVGLNAPLAFDASVKQVWAALLGGHTLVVMPEEARRDPGLLAEKASTLDVLDCTPTQLGLLLDEGLCSGGAGRRETASTGGDDDNGNGGEGAGVCDRLRAVLFGGEATDAKLWARLSALSSEWVGDTGRGCQFYNVYGPTECTVDASVARVSEWPHSPVIGRPVSNARAYVLDSRMQPVPLGSNGELYVGGEGVARGYLGRAELTAERFVPDPFSSESGARMYRTGDEVRWVSGGALEFVGRMDGQVKVRGFRIELGEVEAVLKRHPLLSDAVVVAREESTGEKRLVGYVVAERGSEVSESELRQHLKETLPQFMIPAALVKLERLPLTTNGKVDRRALPDPGRRLPETKESFVEARDLTELRLTQIWEEVLNIHPLSVKDDFFDLGGDSLLALRLVAKLRKAEGWSVPVSALFHEKTIERLSALLRRHDRQVLESSLVCLQPEGAESPFFCVHPIGGNVFCYMKLAREFEAERPFFGFKSYGLEDGQKPFDTIEEMAARYVDELRGVQPEGPYLLGGWSMGGVVAFEMAQQLRAKGQKTKLLAMFDSAPPPAIRRHAKGMPDDATLLRAFFADLYGHAGSAQLPTDNAPGAEDAEEQFGILLERARASDVLPPDTEASDLRRLFGVFKANAHAIWKYRPQPYSERTVLLSAGERAATDSHDLHDGWRTVLSGLEIRRVPGNHYTILNSHNVRALSEQIRSCINGSPDS